jgi:hypothetical protein
MGFNLLQPENKDIEYAMKKYEEDEKYCDKKIYALCIEEMKKINICEINDKDDMQLIRLFLVNWGLLSRAIKGRKYWKKDLSEKLKGICNELERFKELRLEDEEISSHENDIIKCYKEIKSKFGPTTTSKVLHLICPRFFPMWDGKIRKKINSDPQTLRQDRIVESPAGYFKFMKAIYDFMEKNNQILDSLNDKYGWDNNLKIVDEFFMGAFIVNKN